MARFISNIVIITRYLLGLGFLAAAASMIHQYEFARASVVAAGLPAALLPWFVMVVILGAFSLLLGSGQRWAALAMALLAVIAALLLPDGFGDHAGASTFFRNASIASVLLLMAAMVSGGWSGGRQLAVKRALGSNRTIRNTRAGING